MKVFIKTSGSSTDITTVVAYDKIQAMKMLKEKEDPNGSYWWADLKEVALDEPKVILNGKQRIGVRLNPEEVVR